MGLSIRVVYFAVILIFVLTACNSSKKNQDTIKTNEYAEHFHLIDYEEFIELDVLDPWQESKGVSYTYYLTRNESRLPDSLSNKNIISTPLKRVVCMSTTQIAFIDQIGETGTIKAVSGKRYVFNEKIQNNQNVKDIGYDAGINYELIIEMAPDIVLLYGVGSEITGIAKKLNDLGIQTIIIAEHLEPTPLAKLEWIKVFGALYNKRNEADTIFEHTSERYNKLIEGINQIKQPDVLTGLPYKDIWYVSSGNTNIANLIKDAGGAYIWNDRMSGDVSSLDIEAVMLKAGHADIWINTGIANNKKEILAIDKRLANISAFENNAVYNNNKRMNKFGGNDYFESGVTNPDIVLKDLIKIMHPEVMKDHRFYYYNKLE